MRLRTLVRDALYLNWAVPADALPAPPEPLRYQLREHAGRDWAFASALLFRNRGVHLPHLPLVRLSYPQLNLRLYALDGDGTPCVLFREMLMPAWVGPAVRLVSQQPVSSARFDYPEPSRDAEEDAWRWRVARDGELVVTARRGAPPAGEGPRLGGWEETVRFFRERPRGYAKTDGRLRRIETEHPDVAVWPVAAEIADASLLARLLPLDGEGSWPPLHSAFICPRIPFVFALDLVPEVELEGGRLPQAAASTRSWSTRAAL